MSLAIAMNSAGVTRLKVVGLSFALFGLGLSLGSDFGAPNYPTSSGFGPWEANYTVFTHLLDHPNATTTFPLPGPNITASYPDARPDEGWSWSIAVADDIPASDSAVSYYTKTNESKFFTGSRLRLTAPPVLAVPPNDTSHNVSARAAGNYTDWHVCVHYWTFSTLSGAKNITIPDKWRDDDGSCSTIASADCIRDWEAEAIKNYHADGSCSPTNFDDIPSCSHVQIIPKLSGVSTWFNSTTVGRWPGGYHDIILYGGELHDRGNITAYKKTASIPWPVLILWGSWAVRQRQSPGSLVQINTTAKLTCVRAMNATVGSVAPEWNSVASRSHVALEPLWLLFGLSMLAVWL